MRNPASEPGATTLGLNWAERLGVPFDTGLPMLGGGLGHPPFAAGMTAISAAEPLQLFQTEEWFAGFAVAPVGQTLAESTRRIYTALLRATRGWQLARCWNFVPEINAPGEDDLERYRIFSRERSLAFEGEYGADFRSRLPAASAIGTDAETVRVAFVATRGCARHVENPRQLPAYCYPSDYGPRPPSFARATVVDAAAGRTIFISGTAAVLGHATVAPDDTREQLKHTISNLREISHACGIGRDLGSSQARERELTVYLRHAHDLVAVQAGLNESLLRPTDRVVFARADICRRELAVEIEALLSF